MTANDDSGCILDTPGFIPKEAGRMDQFLNVADIGIGKVFGRLVLFEKRGSNRIDHFVRALRGENCRNQ